MQYKLAFMEENMNPSIKINYYDSFSCIADACPLTCCQEWRISVDEETVEKWKNIKLEESCEEGISYPMIKPSECLKEDTTGQVIQLKKDKKCPFLNHKKLCRLVTQLGEDYLSHTCTTFPRQINNFDDRTEYSLDVGCPAVIDLLREHMMSLGFERTNVKEEADELVQVRNMIMTLLQEEKYTLPERMMCIFYHLLELLEQKKLTAKRIKACQEEANLSQIVAAIKGMHFNEIDAFWERNELFLDVVENYRKQKLYTDYIEDLAKQAEIFEKAMEEDTQEITIIEDIRAFEAKLLPYEKLISSYLVVETFGNTLMSDMTLEDMVINFQWLVMEYAVLKQSLFLKWYLTGKKELNYETLRSYMNVIARITGYDAADIREYMENSFEDPIWEWGYLALVVGNAKV